MTQFDFSVLNVADGRTARFTFHSVSLGGKTPYVTVRPATEATKPYFQEVLQRVGKSARQISSGAINMGMLAEGRDDDRRLYPEHIITGWGYVDVEGEDHPGVMPDKDGKDTPFSKAAVADFVKALPNWMFDELRGFAGASVNFVGSGFDAKVAGKN